jgi:hypothetical protein
MKQTQPQPVTMVMLTPDQLGAIVEQAVARATAGRDDESFTLKEAASFLKISTKSLQRKIARGEVVPVSAHPLRIMRSALVRR